MNEKEILVFLFQHYHNIIIKNVEVNYNLIGKSSLPHLLILSQEAISNIEKYPNDKLHRWLGFIQGTLAAINLIDVDTEREFTRPYLHSIHKNIPKSFG